MAQIRCLVLFWLGELLLERLLNHTLEHTVQVGVARNVILEIVEHDGRVDLKAIKRKQDMENIALLPALQLVDTLAMRAHLADY